MDNGCVRLEIFNVLTQEMSLSGGGTRLQGEREGERRR